MNISLKYNKNSLNKAEQNFKFQKCGGAYNYAPIAVIIYQFVYYIQNIYFDGI